MHCRHLYPLFHLVARIFVVLRCSYVCASLQLLLLRCVVTETQIPLYCKASKMYVFLVKNVERTAVVTVHNMLQSTKQQVNWPWRKLTSVFLSRFDRKKWQPLRLALGIFGFQYVFTTLITLQTLVSHLYHSINVVKAHWSFSCTFIPWYFSSRLIGTYSTHEYCNNHIGMQVVGNIKGVPDHFQQHMSAFL